MAPTMVVSWTELRAPLLLLSQKEPPGGLGPQPLLPLGLSVHLYTRTWESSDELSWSLGWVTLTGEGLYVLLCIPTGPRETRSQHCREPVPGSSLSCSPFWDPLTLDPTTQCCCQIASRQHLSSLDTLETEDPDFTSYFYIHPVLSRAWETLKCLSCSLLVKYI